MKLRDKETGKVRTFDFVVISDDYRKDGELTKFSSPFHILVCRSIEQLNEEWENYKPAEPLIKDEKIRKAVRAFSEAIQEKKHMVVPTECITKFVLQESGIGRQLFKIEVRPNIKGDMIFFCDTLPKEEE